MGSTSGYSGHSFETTLSGLNAKLEDISRWRPIENDFKVVVIADRKHQKGGKSNKDDDNGIGDDQKKIIHTPTYLSGPRITDVHHDDWEKYDFDEYDALSVISLGEGKYDFYVNIDNICLQTELKNAGLHKDVNLLTVQFRSGIVLIGLSMVRELSSGDNKNNGLEESIPEMVKLTSRAIAPTLIPMITTLADLDIDESLSSSDISFIND